MNPEEALALTDDELPVYTVLLPVYDEPPSWRTSSTASAGSTTRPTSSRSCCCSRRTTPRRQAALLVRRPAVAPARRSSRTACPRPSPRRATTGCPADRAASSSPSTTPRTCPTRQLKKAVVAFAADRAERRLHAGPAQLLQRRAEPAHPLVLARVLDPGSTSLLPGLDARHVRDPARRHLQPLPHGGVTRHRRLGPVQRHRGRRPRHPAGPARLPTAMIDSTTFEEANSDVVNWIRQRSRWYKGYLQTCWCTCATRAAAARDRLRVATLPDGQHDGAFRCQRCSTSSSGSRCCSGCSAGRTSITLSCSRRLIFYRAGVLAVHRQLRLHVPHRLAPGAGQPRPRGSRYCRRSTGA